MVKLELANVTYPLAEKPRFRRREVGSKTLLLDEL